MWTWWGLFLHNIRRDGKLTNQVPKKIFHPWGLSIIFYWSSRIYNIWRFTPFCRSARPGLMVHGPPFGYMIVYYYLTDHAETIDLWRFKSLHEHWSLCRRFLVLATCRELFYLSSWGGQPISHGNAFCWTSLCSQRFSIVLIQLSFQARSPLSRATIIVHYFGLLHWPSLTSTNFCVSGTQPVLPSLVSFVCHLFLSVSSLLSCQKIPLYAI